LFSALLAEQQTRGKKPSVADTTSPKQRIGATSNPLTLGNCPLFVQHSKRAARTKWSQMKWSQIMNIKSTVATIGSQFDCQFYHHLKRKFVIQGAENMNRVMLEEAWAQNQ
jgi:hypothetical protein